VGRSVQVRRDAPCRGSTHGVIWVRLLACVAHTGATQQPAFGARSCACRTVRRKAASTAASVTTTEPVGAPQSNPSA
ncbi:MAG: hypothetical protein KGS10_14660, partial [Chloroflexi bacterium]|nr:hypothetical protein [Chloroflexota bacterium]